jgi:hypothetical protein
VSIHQCRFVLIAGMPRAGTSMIATVLSRISGVHIANEAIPGALAGLMASDRAAATYRMSHPSRQAPNGFDRAGSVLRTLHDIQKFTLTVPGPTADEFLESYTVHGLKHPGAEQHIEWFREVFQSPHFLVLLYCLRDFEPFALSLQHMPWNQRSMTELYDFWTQRVNTLSDLIEGLPATERNQIVPMHLDAKALAQSELDWLEKDVLQPLSSALDLEMDVLRHDDTGLPIVHGREERTAVPRRSSLSEDELASLRADDDRYGRAIRATDRLRDLCGVTLHPACDREP